MTGDRIPVERDVVADDVRITARFPAGSITAQTGQEVAITLDDRRWMELAKRVISECHAAERELDPGVVVLRVEHALRDAVTRALAAEIDPDRARRRAVAEVLRRLADLVVSGTIRGFSTEAAPYRPGEPASIDVWFQTKRLDGQVSLLLEVPQARAVQR